MWPMKDTTHTMWMCVTRACNCACDYCYQGSHSTLGLEKHMTRDIYERAIRFSRTWCSLPPIKQQDGTARDPASLRVAFYGGEPLLCWDEIERVIPVWREEFERLKRPIKFGVTTNGSLLTDAVRAFFQKENVGFLLSLDGPKRFHDEARPYRGGQGTWDSIPLREILEWRPDQEVAWVLRPESFDPTSGKLQITPEVLREFLALGIRNVVLNLDWGTEWSPVARWNLHEFFKETGLLMVARQRALEQAEALIAERHLVGPEATAARAEANRRGMGCNWWGKLLRAMTVAEKMVQPCGASSRQMIAVSPEGWLYPSQEMVYTSVLPDRAPGTDTYYRVGDLCADPIMDPEAMERTSRIKVSDMRPPSGLDCERCVAKSACIGGCHCRGIGQDGIDPANRFDVSRGHCQSKVAALSGLLVAASISRWVRPVGWTGEEYQGSMNAGPQAKKAKPTDRLGQIEDDLRGIRRKLDSLQIVQVEPVID